MKTRKREGDTTQEQEERGGDKEIERTREGKTYIIDSKKLI